MLRPVHGRVERHDDDLPPDWLPLPVQIFAATDRGSLFTGAALAVALMATTLLVLLAVSRIRTKASYR